MTDTLGFHPQMTGMLDLYNNAKLNIIQSVGCPLRNRPTFARPISGRGSPAERKLWTTGVAEIAILKSSTAKVPGDYPNEEYPTPLPLPWAASSRRPAGNYRQLLA